jgi:hypothetical protein
MKRLKNVLKWLAISVAASIALLLVLNAWFVWSTGTRLEHRLSELRQQGDPIQLADLAREPIPNERNANVFLRRAADDLDAMQKELLVLYPKTVWPTGALSRDEQEKLETLFAAYPRVFPLLEQAAACPDHDPQIDAFLPPSSFLQPNMDRGGKHRVIMRVARARATLLLAKGRTDEALANLTMALRLTRHWRREPLLIGYLITVACEQTAMDGLDEVLRAGTPSPAARQALDAELALHDTMEGYVWALRTERTYSLSSVREIPGTRYWILRGLGDDLELRLIDLFDRYIEQASEPYAKVAAGDKTRPVRSAGSNPYGALVTLLEPSLTTAREPAERIRAMSRCLRIMNALQARPQPEANRVPALADLGIPSEATIDPYTGEPLHIKKSPDGWKVYSVGRDLTDDGGKLDGVTDIGAGPRTEREPASKP